jgi:hypothetical protein
MARADSAHYSHDFVSGAIRAKAWFSVTARMNKQVAAAIAAIGEDAWTPIKYPHAVWEEDEQPGEGHWVSDAEVAETTITVFTSRRKADHVTCRLVVRRVRRLNPLTPAGDGKTSVQAPSASEIGNQDPVLILRILAGSITGLDKEIDDDQADLFGGHDRGLWAAGQA